MKKSFWFLLSTCIYFFILRFPSLFEPNWYGDEGIYQVLGLGIRTGRILYRDVFDNKPPFLYVLYGIFNSDQFLIRACSLIFGLFSVILFFKLSQIVVKNKKAVYVSTFIFTTLFGLPLIEGNIANAENFMLAFNIGGALLVWKALENRTYFKTLFTAGIILSFSFLFKIVALFDFAAFFVFILFTKISSDYLRNKASELTRNAKFLFPYLLGFILPVVIVALYFLGNQAFSYFLKAAFANNIGYVSYGNKFIIPQGLLILKLLILSMALLGLFWKRKNFSNKALFVYIWLFFSLFNAMFSNRPYTHYVLVMLPSLSLLVGILMVEKKKTILNLGLVAATIYILLTNFTYFLKTISYYPNFISFMLGQKSVFDYQNYFDRNTPNDYALASYLNSISKKDDKIFIWGNNAQLYKLTNKLPPGRYTVAYHVTGYQDGYRNTLEGLQKNNPKFIIIMRNVNTYPFSLSKYRQKIDINGVNIYERIY